MASYYDEVKEVYKGVEIYLSFDTGKYYFFYNGEISGLYDSLELVEAQIEAILNPVNPIAFVYRGIPVFTGSRGWMTGGSTAWYFWTINGVGYRTSEGVMDRPLVESMIDEVLGEYTPPEPPPPTDQLMGNYRGIDIYRKASTAEFYFTYQGILYEGFDSEIKAEAKIDELIAVHPTPPLPGETVEIDTSGAASWITGALNGFSGLLANIWGGIVAIGSAVAGIGSALGNLPISLITALTEGLSGLFTKASEESITNTLNIIPEATGHSPEWKQQLDASTRPFTNESIGAVQNALDPKTYEHSALTPEDAASKLTQLGAGITAANIGIWLAHLAAEAGTLGQLEAVGDFSSIVIGNTGINSVASRMALIPLERLIFKPAEQYYNSQYTPEIPPYSDLINMLVKEKISQDEFNKNLAYQGYDQKWAKLIWDAHFQPPTLEDILTAWRRGQLTEAQVDQLMILVDLDPAYKAIFDTRKYDDPSLSTARLMYETGVISRAEVVEIVKRSGLSLEFQPRMVDYIVTFQERRYRTRYIQSLATGYSRGVVEKEELNAKVIEAGFSQGTADWIVKSSDIRKEIGLRGIRFTGVKLLGVNELKESFKRGYMNEDAFRQRLLLQNYELSDIDILIRLLKEDVTEYEQGGKKVALTQSELLSAWRFGELSEDSLRIELQLRGLAENEIEMLLNTKRKQWKIGVEEE